MLIGLMPIKINIMKALGKNWFLLAVASVALSAEVFAADFFAPVERSGAEEALLRAIDTKEVFSVRAVDDFDLKGDLSNEIWKKASTVKSFKPFERNTNPANDCEVKFLYSNTALYIGARIKEPMAVLTARYDQRDQQVWVDDNFEIVLSIPVEGKCRVFQYFINANGAFADLRDGIRTYNTSGAKVLVKCHSDCWTLEMRIPFKGVPMDAPLPGEFIAARFCYRVANPGYVASVPALTCSNHARNADLAKLLFEPGDAKFSKTAVELRKRSAAKKVADGHAEFMERFAEQRAAVSILTKKSNPFANECVGAIRQMEEKIRQFNEKRIDERSFLAWRDGFGKFATGKAYVAWKGDLWAKGTPDDQPPDVNCAIDKLAFEQAGNEREAICINLTGLMTGSRLDLRVVPRSINEKKRFVSCDNFRVYYEPYVRLEGEVLTAPLISAPGNIVTLTPGKTVRVWVVFDSRGVEAGDYRTKVELKPAYERLCGVLEIPVEMKVWNFTLPETRDWPLQSFFWGPFSFRNDEVDMLRLMHDNHITHGWTQFHRYRFGLERDDKVVKPLWSPDAILKFDPELAKTANEEFFVEAKRLGMRFVFGWNTPQDPKWFQLMSERLTGMGFKYEDFVFKSLLRDEFIASDIPLLAERREAVAKIDPGWWFQATMLSLPPPRGPSLEQIKAAKLPQFFKMWTLCKGLADDPKRGKELIECLRENGCSVWSYQCDRCMQRKPILRYYRLYTWHCYLQGLDGVALWTSYSPGGDDGFSSDDGYPEGIVWRGPAKKHTTTKRLEGFREGLEDVAYMNRLEKELAIARKNGREHPEYEKLLAQRAGIVKALDQQQVDKWRLAAGRAVNDLVELNAKKQEAKR